MKTGEKRRRWLPFMSIVDFLFSSFGQEVEDDVIGVCAD